jgi:hypothetical protein
MNGELILRPTNNSENGLRMVKVGDMYQIRIPEKLFPYKGLKSMFITNGVLMIKP